MKKVIYIVLFAIIFGVLIADFQIENNPSPKELTIDIIVKEKGTEFWDSVEIGARSYKGDVPINIKVTGPKNEKDYKKQIKFLQESIERNPDAILIALGNNYGLTKYIEEAKTKKIPVILIDSYIHKDVDTPYIGSDNYEIGAMLAEEIIKIAPLSPHVGVVSFVNEAPAAIEREKSFLAILKKYGIEVSAIVYTDSNSIKAKTTTKEMMVKNPEINVLAGLNAQSTIGAAKAIKELNYEDIIIGGVDLTLEQVGMLEEEILDLSIVQNPFLMGYYSIEAVYLHVIHNNSIEDRIISNKVITKENLFLKENQQLIFPFSSQ